MYMALISYHKEIKRAICGYLLPLSLIFKSLVLQKDILKSPNYILELKYLENVHTFLKGLLEEKVQNSVVN